MRGASPPEAIARVGEVELCYQTIGKPRDPPMLMIMGLAAQMYWWPDGLCNLLVRRGLRLIRFDNRDCGGSSVLDALGVPSLQAALAGADGAAPYTLSKLAGDTVGLLDALGIAAAHVVGASMGAMIAQALAIEHPDRVLSLASIMGTTGERSVGRPTPAAQEVLMRAPPLDDRGAYVESVAAARAVIGSHGLERDEAWTREIAERSFDRGVRPDGTLRQLVAIIASGDRTAALRRLRVPTVVVHGTDDALIDASGGRATAAAIPGAELVLIDGMGHDLPPSAWGQIADAIAANAARAGC
jgi:pimeloyl-ACP methyl ester carboxylesterase